MYSHILSKYLSCAHQLLLADVTDNHLYRSAFAERLTKISYFANEAIWKHRSAFAEWLTLITRTGGIVAQNCCSRYMAEKGDAPKASPKHPITITLTLPVFYRIKGQTFTWQHLLFTTNTSPIYRWSSDKPYPLQDTPSGNNASTEKDVWNIHLAIWHSFGISPSCLPSHVTLFTKKRRPINPTGSICINLAPKHGLYYFNILH